MQQNANHAKTLWNVAAGVVLLAALGWMARLLLLSLRNVMGFDDAYMFIRYAVHMRQGLGMAWNLDGAPTYGPTSLLWVGAVWGLTSLPKGAWTVLLIGSGSCGLGALLVMAWAVAANAQTTMLRSWWRALPLIVLPLMFARVFCGNLVTGMETMLATLLGALYLGVALLWSQGRARGVWVGLTGVLWFLARPEAAIVVLLLPLLLFALKPYGAVSRRALATVLGVFTAGVALDLLACRMYFHTALPLSFYMKSRSAYLGYGGVWHPEILMVGFLSGCQLYLAATVLLTRGSPWRLVACCWVPAAAVFVYLQTVTQIMGFASRYYAPYLAYFIVPAILVAERWWISVDRRKIDGVRLRWGVVTAMLVVFVAMSSQAVQAWVRHAEGRTRFAYDTPVLEITATQSLEKKPWGTTMLEVTDLLVAPLPKGSTVAATEVGYLGSRAPEVNVIDMAGLNDTEIALHGFHAKALLARKPDLIWMPNTDYTYMRGELLAEPGLLADYEVYAGAANYGLCVRKGSAVNALMKRQMETFWRTAYPGTDKDQYRVRSVIWSGSRRLIQGE